MREAAIILPRHYYAQRTLERDLIQNFGGFTRADVTGVWVDDKTGERFDDDNVQYTIAMEVGLRNETVLRRLAYEAGKASDQVTVYVRQADGLVEFVDTGANRHHASTSAKEIVTGDELAVA